MSKVHGKPFTAEQREQIIEENNAVLREIGTRKEELEEKVFKLTQQILSADTSVVDYNAWVDHRNHVENVITHIEKTLLPQRQELALLLDNGWDGRCCWPSTECHDYATVEDVGKRLIPYCHEHQSEIAFKLTMRLPLHKRVLNYVDKLALVSA
jgi:hypothetical protein